MPLQQVELTLMATAQRIGLSRQETRVTIRNARVQSSKQHVPLLAHKLLAARLERHGNPRIGQRA